jgi:soluble lytic murein transglycosylase-like protein
MSAWSRHSRVIALLSCLCASLAAACSHSPATSADLNQPSSDALMVSRGNWTPAEAQRIRQAQPHVQRAASRFKVDPALINGIIWVESKFDPRARGPGGAAGLMQLMPATSRELAKQLGERSRPYNPDFNVLAGTFYIGRLLKRFDGDLRLAIAAYQAGPGSVSKWKKAGRDLPASSKAYVDKVLSAKRRFDGR